jgi:hypothetical protein
LYQLILPVCRFIHRIRQVTEKEDGVTENSTFDSPQTKKRGQVGDRC